MRNNWYTYQFNDAQIAQAKQIRAEKDSNNWGNKFNSNTRWTGYLGELAFRAWLNETQIPYHHWDFINEKDTRDFTVGRLEIDVKTIATNFFPRVTYSCLVAVNQLDNESVNAYVFCRFLLKQNKAVIMGWLPKEQFLDKSEFREKGFKEDNFIVPTDMRKVFIYQLKPLMNLDKYR